MSIKATFIKRGLCTIFLLIAVTSLTNAQQHPENNSQTVFHNIRSGLSLDLSSSIIARTNGMQLTFPAFWVGSRVKLEPLVGFFWEDFSNTFPAGGVRMAYYFKDQPAKGSTANSLYVGVSGMATEFDFFGRDVTNVSVAGLLVGHSFALSPIIELNPEILLGFDELGDFQPEIGASFVIHFGR